MEERLMKRTIHDLSKPVNIILNAFISFCNILPEKIDSLSYKYIKFKDIYHSKIITLNDMKINQFERTLFQISNTAINLYVYNTITLYSEKLKGVFNHVH